MSRGLGTVISKTGSSEMTARSLRQSSVFDRPWKEYLDGSSDQLVLTQSVIFFKVGMTINLW